MKPDPQTLAWLDQEDSHTKTTVRRHGWSVEYVMADPDVLLTSIAYTIGLFGLGHPELVLLGCDPDTACAVLNDIGARIRAGIDLLPGELVTFDGWVHRATVEIVPNPDEILFAASRFYAGVVPAFQLTIDDVHGRFPWDEGYCRPAWVQPRPGAYRA